MLAGGGGEAGEAAEQDDEMASERSAPRSSHSTSRLYWGVPCLLISSID